MVNAALFRALNSGGTSSTGPHLSDRMIKPSARQGVWPTAKSSVRAVVYLAKVA